MKFKVKKIQLLKPSKTRAMFAGIWIIATGLVLSIVGSVIANAWTKSSMMNIAGFSMLWAGVAILVCGIAAVAASASNIKLQDKYPQSVLRILFAGVYALAIGIGLAVIGSVFSSTFTKDTIYNTTGFAMLLTGATISVFGGFGIASGATKLALEKKTEPATASLETEAPHLLLECEPSEIIADGMSKSIVYLKIVDKEGKPIAVPADTRVKMCAGSGTLQRDVVTIPKGQSSERTIIVSSRESGPVTISAEAEGLDHFSITLNFVEKKRYCMLCGALFPLEARICRNCGQGPPAGRDTKVCHNCKSVIPSIAKFCRECGAGQLGEVAV